MHLHLLPNGSWHELTIHRDWQTCDRIIRMSMITADFADGFELVEYLSVDYLVVGCALDYVEDYLRPNPDVNAYA